MGDGHKKRTSIPRAIVLGLLTSSLVITPAFAQSGEDQRGQGNRGGGSQGNGGNGNRGGGNGGNGDWGGGNGGNGNWGGGNGGNGNGGNGDWGGGNGGNGNWGQGNGGDGLWLLSAALGTAALLGGVAALVDSLRSRMEDCDSASDTVLLRYGKTVGEDAVFHLFDLLDNRCVDLDTLVDFVEELMPATEGKACLASGYMEGMYNAVEKITDNCIALAE